MSDTLTTITHLINSPPGQLAAGGVLAGIVWKFFERVESVLNDSTKLEIAVWLVGVKPSGRVLPAASSLGKSVLDFLYEGFFSHPGHFIPSKAALILILWPSCYPLTLVVRSPMMIWSAEFAWFLGVFCVLNGCLVLMFGTRIANLTFMVLESLEFRKVSGVAMLLMTSFVIVLFQLFQSVCTYSLAYHFLLESNGNAKLLSNAEVIRRLWRPELLFSLCLLPSPLILAAAGASGLRLVCQFDIGFDWFNRHFDIEKKPLQSIGLVAGALVAIVYWAVMIVGRAL
jgi:hypothetical protein